MWIKWVDVGSPRDSWLSVEQEGLILSTTVLFNNPQTHLVYNVIYSMTNLFVSALREGNHSKI